MKRLIINFVYFWDDIDPRYIFTVGLHIFFGGDNRKVERVYSL